MSIGANIKRIRKKRHMTQKELGEKLGGISQQQIGQWENGIKKPKIETLIKIASALNCATTELNDEILDLHIGYGTSKQPIIVDGVIHPDILNIADWLNEDDSLVLTEGEKLIVYYNSLNDEGKDKVFEYMELLLSTKQYRNQIINEDMILRTNEEFDEYLKNKKNKTSR